MYYIIDNSNDPQWNLAAEEYLLKRFTKPVFRLWQNRPSIIIGLHQNAYAEINVDFVKKNNITVVRRLSGGGAVFHDLGNVNFTFIDNKIANEESSAMFARFTKPIIEALKELGVAASLKGRNDLVIDDRKFSGNAVAIYKDRILQHGTLLFSASIEDLSGALAGRPEQFKGKAVSSNRSRVTNISEHLLSPMKTEEFISFLENYITKQMPHTFERYSYSPTDLSEISKLTMEKYSKDSWNFGSSPQYSYSKVEKFECGMVELYMEVERGVISQIKFYGSYFFTRESVELEELLRGKAHTEEAISEVISKINLSDYFSNITREEFLSMFWK